MDKLFTAVKEGYDQKNRIVFIIKTDAGFSVTNPRTGFASKAWQTEDDPELLACFARQCANSQNHASYLPGERDEEVATQAAADAENVNAGTADANAGSADANAETGSTENSIAE